MRGACAVSFTSCSSESLQRELWTSSSCWTFSVAARMRSPARSNARRCSGGSHSPMLRIPALAAQFRSLRSNRQTDWAALIEPLIAFDAAAPGSRGQLREDGLREPRVLSQAHRLRCALFRLHRMQVAKYALDLAGRRATHTSMILRLSAPPYSCWLLPRRQGFPQLARRVGFHPPSGRTLRTVVRTMPTNSTSAASSSSPSLVIAVVVLRSCQLPGLRRADDCVPASCCCPRCRVRLTWSTASSPRLFDPTASAQARLQRGHSGRVHHPGRSADAAAEREAGTRAG